jgi:sugar lactone lactonase YvrE
VPRPFPLEGRWNSYKPGDDARTGFVAVNAIRIGPDGKLWITDIGAPMIGKPHARFGPKIVCVDLGTDKVERTYIMDKIAPNSGLDDLRIYGRTAYITDAGRPGLIVLNLDSGASYRVLDGHPSMTDQKPLRGPDGKALRDPSGKLVKIHADQLEVTPDGKTLYYQACDGPLYKIGTRWLRNDVTDAERARHIQLFAKTVTTSGSAIDAAGNVYIGNSEKSRIEKYSPSGKRTILVQSPNLVWPDAMWIDEGGNLWIPAAQQNRSAGMNGGKERTVFPVKVYKLPIGAKPFRS